LSTDNDEYKKYFPYREFRYGQLKAIKEAAEIVALKGHLILRAPSGFGKTITILTATLPTLERETNCKMVWLCRTNRENNRVIEETRKISNIPSSINAIAIEARAKLCMKDIGQDLKKDHEAFSILCSEIKRQGRCEYYNKLRIENVKLPQICGVKELMEACEKNDACPYEVAKKKIPNSRIIVANYNYILIPQILKTLNTKLDNSILVIDEAHNLPEIATEIEMEKVTIRGLNETALEMMKEGVGEYKWITDEMIKVIDRNEEDKVIDKNYLRSILEGKCGNLSQLASALIKIGDHIRRRIAREGGRPVSHIHHLGKFLMKVYETLDREEYEVFSGNGEMWIECFDPSNMIRRVYKMFRTTISMSGTINENYGELVGLDSYRYREVNYIERRNILPILVPNVTTDYDMREPKMYQRICEYISIVAENINTGIGVFTASYEVLEGLLNAGIRSVRKPMYIESRNESPKINEWKIEEYKRMAKTGGAIYVGVCGGRASEGEDFPGEEMDIVLLVGIPFPEPSIRIQKRNKYYEKRFGENGSLYSYIIPSIWKAAQAAGRVIRGPEDRGAIIYLDERYKRYIKLLPEWLRPRKIVREPEQLKEELTLFLT
jgi:DNA excision repair protein ERCC-2